LYTAKNIAQAGCSRSLTEKQKNNKMFYMKSRISMDLGNPKLLRLVKLEADEMGTSMKEVLIRALETYFSHRLETKALGKASESVFEEWDNPLDSDYDRL
jgi:hypothetical protein